MQNVHRFIEYEYAYENDKPLTNELLCPGHRHNALRNSIVHKRNYKIERKLEKLEINYCS